MLVLSRRDGEQILVGNDVVIKVLSVAGGRVRVGIDAPREVSIRRSEIALRFATVEGPGRTTRRPRQNQNRLFA